MEHDKDFTKSQLKIVKFLRKNFPDLIKSYDQKKVFPARILWGINPRLKQDEDFVSLVENLTSWIEPEFLPLRIQARFFQIIHGFERHPLCHACAKPILIVSHFKRFNKRGYRYCSVECKRSEDAQIISRSKAKDTYNHRTGYAHQMNNPEVIQKISDTCMNKYGVSWSTKDQSVLDKIKTTSIENGSYETALVNRKATMLDRHGVDNPMKLQTSMDKRRVTNQERYGGIHPMHSPEVRANWRETCQELTGFDHYSQDPAIRSKQRSSSFQTRDFKIGGKTFSVQGYEHHALRYLCDVRGYSAEDILGEGEFEYCFPYIQDNKVHYYHPDFFIPDENRIVEVKSTFTLFGKKKWWKEIKNKRASVIKAGNNFNLVLMDGKRRIDLPANWFELSYMAIRKVVQSK